MNKQQAFEYISDAELDHEISNHDEIVLLFIAKWHRASQDLLSKLSALRFKPSIKVLLMNVDENPHKPVEFAITRLPKLFVYRKDQPRILWPNSEASEGLESFLEKNHLLEK